MIRMTAPQGMKPGLTSYGDADFSLFLRKAFIKAMGFSDDALDAADRRHRQHVQRLQRLPRQRAEAGRGGQARGDAGRRAADGVPDDLDPRVVRLSDEHVPAQPDGDGHGGDAARAADGRGGAHRRLRQDDPGADDGRRVGRGAGGRSCRSGRCWSATSAARRSARAPTAAACGATFAAAGSAPTRSMPSTAASRRRRAPAW